jgi:hypothetical protein
VYEYISTLFITVVVTVVLTIVTALIIIVIVEQCNVVMYFQGSTFYHG